MTTTDTRKPYSGKKLSLVLAFDVGTTFSGVSYAVLEPKEIPKIQSVTRYVRSLPSSPPLISLSSFPGQEPVSRSYKVPTIMYYDQEGNMTAGGAEAEGLAVAELAEDCGWTKAELCALSSSSSVMLWMFNAPTTDSSFDSGPRQWNPK